MAGDGSPPGGLCRDRTGRLFRSPLGACRADRALVFTDVFLQGRGGSWPRDLRVERAWKMAENDQGNRILTKVSENQT